MKMKELIEFYRKAYTSEYNARRLGLHKCAGFFECKFSPEEELLEEIVQCFRKNRSKMVQDDIYEKMHFSSLEDFVEKTKNIRKTKGLRTIAEALLFLLKNSTEKKPSTVLCSAGGGKNKINKKLKSYPKL